MLGGAVAEVVPVVTERVDSPVELVARLLLGRGEEALPLGVERLRQRALLGVEQGCKIAEGPLRVLAHRAQRLDAALRRLARPGEGANLFVEIREEPVREAAEPSFVRAAQELGARCARESFERLLEHRPLARRSPHGALGRAHLEERDLAADAPGDDARRERARLGELRGGESNPPC